MKQHNFKTGDRVRIIGNGKPAIRHHYEIDDIVTIERVDSDGDFYCVNERGLHQIVSPEQVELFVAAPIEENPDVSALPEIKDGYLLVVKTKNETHNMTVVSDKFGKLAAVTPKKHWWAVDRFDDQGVYDCSWERSEILAIYGRTFAACLLDNSTDHRELLWERKKPDEPKKMTVAEVCEALGYEVEIVK